MESPQSYSPAYLSENRSRKLLNFGIAFGCLEVFFAILYFYTRFRNKTVHGWDSYLMVPAFAFCFALCVTIILLVKYGGDGHHLVTVPANEIVIWLKLEVAVIFLYFPAVTLPKMAVLCLYLRICTTRGYRLATYGIGALLVLIAVVLTIVASVQCVPFAYNWDKTIPGGHCFNLERFYTWVGLPNIITDIAMLILPLPLVWRLHTSVGQKVGLTLTFFTGSIGIFTAIMRFVQFQNPNTFAELTWTTIDDMIWTAAEPGVYFIAACLPALRSWLKPWPGKGSKRSTRAAYLASGSKSSMGGENSSRNGSAARAPKSAKIHLKRLGNPFSEDLEDGSDERGLVACYRSTGSRGRDSREEHVAPADTIGRGPVIQVQKTYSLSTVRAN